MLTLPSVAGEFSARGVPLSERVELLKWVAFAFMLVDHAGQYLGVELPAWNLLGRGAFPLFALTVGYGLAVGPDTRAMLLRLIYCGTMAEVLGAWSVTGGQLNVLFLFALAAWQVHLSRVSASLARRAVALALAIVLAVATEYGIAGLVLVMVCWWFWCGTSRTRALCVVLVSLLLVVPNYSFLGTWWLVGGLALLLLPVGVPRLKRAFYWGYVAQWPLLWVLR